MTQPTVCLTYSKQWNRFISQIFHVTILLQDFCSLHQQKLAYESTFLYWSNFLYMQDIGLISLLLFSFQFNLKLQSITSLFITIHLKKSGEEYNLSANSASHFFVLKDTIFLSKIFQNNSGISINWIPSLTISYILYKVAKNVQ